MTYERVDEDPQAALGEIVARYHALARQCDAVVVIGSDYTGVFNPTALTFDARVEQIWVRQCCWPSMALTATPSPSPRLPSGVLPKWVPHTRAGTIIGNRCDPEHLDEIRAALDTTGVPSFTLPEVPLLAAPTMAELCEALDGTLYSGDPELLRREALSVMVGGMNAEHILERLAEGQVVIVPADRSEVLLALVTAHHAQGFPSLAGIILNGGLLPHPAIDKLLNGVQPTLPLIATRHGTYRTAELASHTRARMRVGALRKIDTALEIVEHHIDGTALVRRMQVPAASVVTPQMFEYRLLDRARGHRRHIVLPEGNDDRILLAAGRLLVRGIVDLSILGAEAVVRRRGAELGVDLANAQVLDPESNGLRDKFGAEYARLRAHKGITEDRAREIMCDVSYFGTMMVHLALADGMVSGAAHTTAHTIRPSFEIIKTAPGVSTVSSVFLMCLSDRVLAFGDCAVVPDPTIEQLADIAISSAGTTAKFGIDPKIAMLSYSTGESGSGADVDKVRAATQLVRDRRPDLLVEGPIQYDAAVNRQLPPPRCPDRWWPAGGHGAGVPGSQRRQQHLQGGPAHRRGCRDRAGSAGLGPAGQRSVPRGAGG